MRVLSLVLAVLVCVACGGGDSSVATVVSRTDRAMFGYYGDAAPAEVAGHADLAFVFGWPSGTVDATVSAVCAAQAAGQRVVLGVAWRYLEATAYTVGAIRDAGCLAAVVGAYPQDEPERAGLTDAEVRTLVADTRRVLPGVAVWVVFGCTGNLPGFSAFDVVGRDCYGKGPQMLPTLPGQRLLVIAGGAFREPPDAYVVFSQQHPEVIAMVGFLWVWPDGHCCAIRDNGMAPAYIAAGKALLGR